MSLTWQTLAEQEPRLADLDAQMARAHPCCCSSATGPGWYAPTRSQPSYKGRMSDLVGWGRGLSTVPKHPTITGPLLSMADVAARADWHRQHTADDRQAHPDLYTPEAYDVAYDHLFAHVDESCHEDAE